MTALAQPAPAPASAPALAAAEVLRPAPPSARVQGYVEAMTDRRVVGWAWSPDAPGARLRILLRDGEAELESCLADQSRPDLAQNGVGDGAHAFAFDIDPGLAARAAALEVVAIAPDGTEAVLSAPPAPARGPEELRRTLDGLVASQRVMHRNLQALLLAAKAREPLDAALDRIAQAQQALDARAAELELFVARLDERLAALGAEAPEREGGRMRVALGLAIALMVCGVAGVAAHLLR